MDGGEQLSCFGSAWPRRIGSVSFWRLSGAVGEAKGNIGAYCPAFLCLNDDAGRTLRGWSGMHLRSSF